MFRRTSVLFLATVLLLLSTGVVLAQDALPTVFCGDLDAEDCELLQASAETMAALTSGTTTMEFDIEANGLPGLPISEADIAFYVESAFVMDPDLAPEDITVLETRTEAWIAGLQLAAISIQGQQDAAGLMKAFTGSHRFVLDYLIEEVLDQQPESVQTAVLDRLTGSLCDALSGQDNGQETLEMLDRATCSSSP